LLAVGTFTSGEAKAQAQAPDLFAAVPSNRLNSASDAQNQQLDQLRRRPSTLSLDLVRANTNALKGRRVRIAIPGDGVLTLSKTSGDVMNDREYSWAGAQDGKQPASATFVVEDGKITGSIHAGTTLYRVSPVSDGVHAIVKVDTRKFPQEEPPTARPKEDFEQQLEELSNEADNNIANVGPTEIDVQVAYTPSASSSVTSISSTIALAVAEANQAYVNSRVKIHLNLVDSYQVSYAESGKTYDQILADFKAMSVVNQHRDSSGADLSALIINQTDYCGLADAIKATAGTAFAIVHYDCATGYYSFAHELGHLMGARHNTEVDATGTPYAFGHGFLHTSAPAWRTIMAYDCPAGCTRLQYFSNPDVNYGGVAMGTVGLNNNARVLNLTASTVAGFRIQPTSDVTIWHYTGFPCVGSWCPGWQALDNNTRTLRIVAGGGNLYQMHVDGKIWRSTDTPCTGASCPGWELLDDNQHTITIASDGASLYQLHDTGAIWRYTGTPCSSTSCPGWQQLDSNPNTAAITADGGYLYQMHSTGLIWRYTGVPCSSSGCPGWQLLDNNPKTVSIVAGGSDLYQMHNDGLIWRYTGVPCSGSGCPGWQLLDNNPSTTAIAADSGYLYQLHNSGLIWRFTGVACSSSGCPGWQLLDNNPATGTIAVDGGNLYQLHKTGLIWRYTGTPCSTAGCPGWQLLDNNPRTIGIAAGGNQLYQLHGSR
jgi:hypothetical protein